MKRSFCLLLSIIMVLSVSGCGKSESENYRLICFRSETGDYTLPEYFQKMAELNSGYEFKVGKDGKGTLETPAKDYVIVSATSDTLLTDQKEMLSFEYKDLFHEHYKWHSDYTNEDYVVDRYLRFNEFDDIKDNFKEELDKLNHSISQETHYSLELVDYKDGKSYDSFEAEKNIYDYIQSISFNDDGTLNYIYLSNSGLHFLDYKYPNSNKYDFIGLDSTYTIVRSAEEGTVTITDENGSVWHFSTINSVTYELESKTYNTLESLKDEYYCLNIVFEVDNDEYRYTNSLAKEDYMREYWISFGSSLVLLVHKETHELYYVIGSTGELRPYEEMHPDVSDLTYNFCKGYIVTFGDMAALYTNE